MGFELLLYAVAFALAVALFFFLYARFFSKSSDFAKVRQGAKNEVKDLEERLVDLRNAKNRAKAKYMKGELDWNTYNKVITDFEKEEAIAEGRLNMLKSVSQGNSQN
jgi:chromosome segregation ATPase